MATLPPQPVSITCPNCRTPFQTPVFQLVDVGQQPELKQALLSGRLNVAVCPKCGAGGLLATPLVYHDPDKQLFFSLFPQEIQAKPEEQERFVGALQGIVMQTLPADKPKGYLLNPRRFITFTSMLDAILEAEGISKEALAAQRKRTELLGRLLQADQDEAAIQKLVDDNRDALDYEFFVTLAAYIEASEAEGDTESLERFTTLRDRLLELTGFNEQLPGGVSEPNVNAAVEALLAADASNLRELIAEHRDAIDYEFYEAITEQAETARAQGNTAEAERIEAQRTLILQTTEQMDRDAQALFEGAAQTLREVLQAPDLRQALVERRDQLSEAFLLVVAANKEAAHRANQPDIIDRLNQIEQLAVEVVQESLSPEERFIGELLNAPEPKDATKLLRQNAAKITPALVKRINELAEEMDGNGRKELGDRLRQLGRESASMLF
ncbi:MAG: CpXC domain-containing protein [Chloroflexota bacterium]|nr:CpXC domain-containing protein [Chloroflexota bacterium]